MSMSDHGSHRWMWWDAVTLIERVDRLNRQSFTPERPVRGQPCWEPPVDVLETDSEVLILVALPGVDPEEVVTTIEGRTLVIIGQRTLPPQLRTAVIHRIELPQGRFERRIPLPPGRYDTVQRAEINGCLLVTLRKVMGAGGEP